MEKDVSGLLKFIDDSPTAFHAIANMEERLKSKGFTRLYEEEEWELSADKGYYVIRNDSSLIAFHLPKKTAESFQIVASHSDSPAFKIKSNAEETLENKYVKLNVEKYGGMLMAPWFDRPLSIAGRVILRKGSVITGGLLDMERDLVMIPSLAIHMDRDANSGRSLNAAKDMLPLYSMVQKEGDYSLGGVIAEKLNVSREEILGTDLFLYNREKGTIWGADESFVSAPRLDDLQCAYCSLNAFLLAKENPNRNHISVHAVFDNEEVGSLTRQGAASTFLKDTLERISGFGGKGRDRMKRMAAASFMISADNAHAVHPNYADKSDTSNRPYLNGGVVLKYSANQKYTTDGMTGALFCSLCDIAGADYQIFTNRSDMPGGSTLGNISSAQLPIPTVDVGLPQLAMHSPYESAGVNDTADMIRVLKVFYESDIMLDRNGYHISGGEDEE